MKYLYKIPSVLRNVPLKNLEICYKHAKLKFGDLIITKYLGNITCIESINGRTLRVFNGDTLIGSIGMREASKGIIGYPPKGIIRPGDKLYLLSEGGLMGIIRSIYPKVKLQVEPFKYIGILKYKHKIANISSFKKIIPCKSLIKSPPLVFFIGTSMETGKTTAAAMLTNYMFKRGYKIAYIKATGTARLKDLLFLKDAGAIVTLDFVDAGFPSTPPYLYKKILEATKGLINYVIQKYNVDCIFIELAGNFLFKMNLNILLDKEIKKFTKFIILSAYDEIGAIGGVKLLKEKKLNINLVTGMLALQKNIKKIISEIKLPVLDSISEINKIGDLLLHTLNL